MKILENFANVKVLVIGDVMLDRFWWGSVSRISPEAPVPVVNLRNMSLAAGGAANVAANIAGLGAEALLVGISGDDAEAELFPGVLKNANVGAEHLIKISGRLTTVKTRIIAHSQQVVRVDQENTAILSAAEEAKVWKTAVDLFDKADVIVISDYAKGLLTDNLLTRLITTASKNNKFILVDPKGKNYDKYRGATLLTPNRKEAAEACNLDENEPDLIAKSGNTLMKQLAVKSVLITQGEAGMTLFRKDESVIHLSSLARKVYDVTGAGDTVIAVLSVALAAGADLPTAAKIANTAAGLVVQQVGTTAITAGLLRQALSKSL